MQAKPVASSSMMFFFYFLILLQELILNWMSLFEQLQLHTLRFIGLTDSRRLDSDLVEWDDGVSSARCPFPFPMDTSFAQPHKLSQCYLPQPPSRHDLHLTTPRELEATLRHLAPHAPPRATSIWPIFARGLRLFPSNGCNHHSC